MNIDFMRTIDYWIGIPLCFFLSVLNAISTLFQKQKIHKYEKILFIKPSEIGGIILSYPLMNQIKKDSPDAKLFFLTFKTNKNILKVLNIIPHANILTIDDKSALLFLRDVFKIIVKLRREKIDISIDLDFFSRFTAITTYLSGSKKRIGFASYTLEGLYRGNLLTHKIQYNPHIHTSKLYLAFYQTLNLDKKDTPGFQNAIFSKMITLPKFIPSDKLKDQIWEKLKKSGIKKNSKLILMNTGEGLIPLREWPLEHFIDLSKRFLEDTDNHLIIVGTLKYAKNALKLLQEINHKRIINLSGKTSIPQLLTLFYISEFLISNDSGIAHLASLTKIKQFTFFGPEHPNIFAPQKTNIKIFYSHFPCSPCLSAYNHRKSICRDNQCLKKISPEMVHETIKKNL